MQKYMKVLVTGSGGLIGSESCRYYLERGVEVVGIDNNMRRTFFGSGGDTTDNLNSLRDYRNFTNFGLDIRDRSKVLDLMKSYSPLDLIVHTAAQPSHDWAAREPFTDFDINAVGTLNLLEATRLNSPEAVFIFTSTNKVYGDNPNKVKLIETDTRFDYDSTQNLAGVTPNGISEEMSLDRCTHSLFGVSKVAADLLVQEYGRYFGMKTGVFRGGCLTGPQHSAVELHGFLAYIVDCATKGKKYNVFGYKGKQVRDQIHSRDVVSAFDEFFLNPKPGEAYNLGGTRKNAASVLEVIGLLKDDFGLTLDWEYVEKNRVGDHICYYSDMFKFQRDFPRWRIKHSLKGIVSEIIKAKEAK